MQNASTPAPPAPPQVRAAQLSQSPTAIYRAQLAQRRELRDQLDGLQSTRGQLTGRLEDATGADRIGIEHRLADVDARIAVVDKQLAAADAEVARAAGVPGAVVEEPRPVRSDPPDGAYVLGGLFLVVAVLPLSIAMARRIWRRSSAVVAALPQDLMERITRLEQAVDSIAVEIERIGEGQRFVTRLFTDKGTAEALGAPPSGSRSLLEERGGS
jgi:hypothetical protein